MNLVTHVPEPALVLDHMHALVEVSMAPWCLAFVKDRGAGNGALRYERPAAIRKKMKLQLTRADNGQTCSQCRLTEAMVRVRAAWADD